jgi:glycosyltransferase involved in cell wall biosynthesis
MKHTLCIACLSWKKPAILRRTLETYKQGGLLDYADEKLVFFNEYTPDDIQVANDYDIHAIGSASNVGIGAAFKAMAKQSQSKYILFLENDFILIENKEVVKKQLDMCKALINCGSTNAIKLRHRVNPGDPLYSRGLIQRDRYLSMVHWSDLSKLPKEVKSFNHKGNRYWQSTAENSNYTNNPSMYDRVWFLENISPFCNRGGIALEGDIQKTWATWSNVIITQTEGLFCHKP